MIFAKKCCKICKFPKIIVSLHSNFVNMTRTPISKLGEFGLIRHLTQELTNHQSSTQYGVGDDAAVLNHSGKRTLVTTDLLLEGIHFNLEYVPLRHLGYKAVAVNVSDICAMNVTPTQITVGLGVSSRFAVEDMEEFYAGVRAACEHYKVDLVGGDTCASMNGLTIAVTVLARRTRKISFIVTERRSMI